MQAFLLLGVVVAPTGALCDVPAPDASMLSGRSAPPPAILPLAAQRLWRATLGCGSCAGTRAVPCPNCEGEGGYTAMGGVAVACRACRSTGRVVCRDCFTGDGYDIEAIRRRMGFPD